MVRCRYQDGYLFIRGRNARCGSHAGEKARFNLTGLWAEFYGPKRSGWSAKSQAVGKPAFFCKTALPHSTPSNAGRRPQCPSGLS